MITSHKRRNFLSYPAAQWRIIRIFALLAIVFALTNYFVGRAALTRVIDHVSRMPLQQATFRHDLDILYEREASVLSLQLTLFGLLSTMAVVIGAVFVSHVIAGPIYRLRKYLAELTQGATPRPITFRKQDLFEELAESFNEFQRSREILPREPDPPKPPATDEKPPA
jgi:hypothetical protein